MRPEHRLGSRNPIGRELARARGRYSGATSCPEHTNARRTFKVANRRADHHQFVAYRKGLSGRVRVAFEPTGDYHRPLAYRLLSEGFEVPSVSSVAVARIREARYGNWVKNDSKDAQVILYMLEQGIVQTYYDPLFNGAHDIQELANTHFHVKLARTRLQHTLLLHYVPLLRRCRPRR